MLLLLICVTCLATVTCLPTEMATVGNTESKQPYCKAEGYEMSTYKSPVYHIGPEYTFTACCPTTMRIVCDDDHDYFIRCGCCTKEDTDRVPHSEIFTVCDFWGIGPCYCYDHYIPEPSFPDPLLPYKNVYYR